MTSNIRVKFIVKKEGKEIINADVYELKNAWKKPLDWVCGLYTLDICIYSTSCKGIAKNEDLLLYRYGK